MEACNISSSASLTNFSSVLNTPYCQRFRPSSHPHPAVVFSLQNKEEKLPAYTSGNGKYSNDKKNAVGSRSHEFESRPSASVFSGSPLNAKSFSVPAGSRWRSLAAVVCNVVDDFINNYMEKRPLSPWLDPRFVLAGNFAPVDETPPVECVKLEGTLPACLNGVYVRNGPNPRYVPRSGYHLFDGDGMLHALTIKDGWATFCSRFVRTHKFVQEEMAGRPVMPNIFSDFQSFGAGLARVALLTARVALSLFNPSNGVGSANTSVIYFNQKLMALVESDLPYVVKVTELGHVETVGRYGFNGRNQLAACMTAHPKIDPETGELFAFHCGPIHPFLNYFRVSPTGEKEPDVGVLSMLQPSLIHDFAITKRYAIFPDTQIVLKMKEMIMGGGSPVSYDKGKVPRLGIILRYATDESSMKWFDVPGLNFFHSLNAWEEGEEIVLVGTNLYPVEHFPDRTHLLHGTLEKVRINLKTGSVSRKALSSKSLEFGVMNPRYLAKKNRYAYMSIVSQLPKTCGVVKLDFDMACKGVPAELIDTEECVVASRLYGDGCFGSEPFFVSRTSDLNAEENDGYIVAFVHNEVTGISSFLVMEAQSATLAIVASLELPSRIPYSFKWSLRSRWRLGKSEVTLNFIVVWGDWQVL